MDAKAARARERAPTRTADHTRPAHRGLPPLDALAADRRKRRRTRATALRPQPASARRRLGPGADRLDDMQQMRAHRPLGGVGIVRGDGVDDGGVLRQRLRAPARGEDRAELEAHELGVQRRGEPDGRLVPGDLEQPTVQAGVDVGHPQEVPGLQQRPHLPQQAAKLGDVVLRRVERGAAHRQALERRARLDDLDRLALGDEADLGAAVALVGDQPVLLETHQRGADRGAAEPEGLAQLGLDQALARLQGARGDGVAQHLVAGWPWRRAHVGAILGGVRGRIVANPSANGRWGAMWPGRSRSRVAPASLRPRRSRAARRRARPAARGRRRPRRCGASRGGRCR